MISADNLLQIFSRPIRSLHLFACALAVALFLGGCGGDGNNDNSPTAMMPDPGIKPSSVTLAWDAPEGAPSVSGYRLYYGNASGMYEQALGAGISTGNVTTYTVEGLNQATRIYFTVTAVDAQGNESGYSNEVSKDLP